jgi:pfkB family carbohydrate kinase
MDYIHRGTETRKKQFGGILYSLVSLAAISGTGTDIYPVMNLGEDEFGNVMGLLSGYPNIITDCIRSSEHKTRVVNLYYKDTSSVLNISGKKTYDREENSTEPTLPVEYELIESKLSELDGILVNMVSGVDLELETLLKIRANFSGYIHMDLHNLLMQTFPDGTRQQMPVKNWQKWVESCDTLQMNESEFALFTGDNVNEYETAEKILSQGSVNAIVITRGRQGVSLYERKQKESAGEKYFDLDRADLPSIDSVEFIDSTGCGDVFASGFFYKNLEGKNLKKALHYANRLAGRNASLHGVEDLHKLN